MNRVRVLFLPLVDANNVNAQSLNVREIALRLDPQRFHSTLWFEHEPDPRLLYHSAIRLEKLPRRGKTLRILGQMISGCDLIGYMDFSPASYLFLRLPKRLRHGAKAVLHAEGISQLLNPSRMFRFLYEGVYERCDIYTGITQFVAEDLYRKFGKRTSYILPVGVDTNLFKPPAARTNSIPVVLFAGAVVARKGPQIVIDAAAQFPKAMFRIVGGARNGFGEELHRRIVELGLQNVSLEGPRTQSQLLEIMQNSDIFLLPSRLEGMPKVSLEAAATGLPCVVFSNYQTPSVVNGVTGFQVGTQEEMMDAVGKLLEDRSLRDRMGKHAREHVMRFDWDIVSQHWQNAYLAMADSRVS